MTHFHDSNNMKPIYEAMSTIFVFSDCHVNFTSKSHNLIEDSILCEFIEKYYLADQCAYLFEIFFNCPDSTARSAIS